MSTPRLPGALVISLDFELHWGMRDHLRPTDPSFAELSSSRAIVGQLCELFAERGIHATWATVGFLFALKKQELRKYLPAVRPRYQDPALNPYEEIVGDDESSDPEHLAGSLVRLVASTPGQEVASHTFSHFYCLEPGQDEDAFRADLAAAQAIAGAQGLKLTSLVLPRNQWNPHYNGAILENGFNCYRGPQLSWGYRSRSGNEQGLLPRMARLADAYAGISPPPTTAWDQIRRDDGLCNIPASSFLRPYDPHRKALEPLRRARLKSGLQEAGRRGRIFHLWWHPHNFSRHPRECFDLLNFVFDEFATLTTSDGMLAISMRDVTTILQDAQ